MTAPLQQALATLLAGPRAAALHEARYNMLAHPYATAYQNSNQWVLETLAAAYEPAAGTRAQAQAWLRHAGYRPALLHLGTATRLGARLFRANVAFDDQPFGPRMQGRIETVTVDSIVAFLTLRGAVRTRIVRLE
ncbi:MAG TPA: DUF2145 domain-containing protein [Burkholderiaceae bacterium]